MSYLSNSPIFSNNPILSTSPLFVDSPLLSNSSAFSNPLLSNSYAFGNPLLSNSSVFSNPLLSTSAAFGNPLLSTSAAILNSPLIVDTPLIIDTPVFSDTSIYVSPTYGNSSFISPYSPIHSTVSDFIAPGVIDSPVLSTLDLTYSQPLFGVYENLNLDPDVHRKYIDHYYFKTLDKWLYDELSSVLKFFTVSGDDVRLIKKMSDYKDGDTSKLKSSDVEKIVDYLQLNLFNKTDMLHILHNFVKDTRVNWFDLPKHEYFVSKAVKKYLKKKLEKAVTKSK